ncbi:flagellar basal-body rod protein FlgG [Sedimentibacter acidaminivorans]|uniref:Flagellar basal-body rod protein FlgG n=1 Tax=Sedimentibacter acidaminivorans TaxID=913099 RepID=A0ABS4GDF3_9FIRM|nr:flagellar hook-basal body protein [Sedimentibacter acidaminivorans]MBP1925732.1 flagellar basal-body rod protein FlgG [Sedimentibacter acidaminivorans]
MSRGFYALTSGMLTQQRKIDISSNNIANMNTAGYKKEQAVTTNFGNLLISKYKQKGIYEEATPINNVSIIRAMEDNNTIHSQGTLEETGLATDFAIIGPGFFSIDNNGETVYTRDGSFNIDLEGYLTLNGVGRVQGEYGDIYVGTDKFDFNEDGSIVVDDEEVDRIALYDFFDYNNLEKSGEGMFTSGEVPDLLEYSKILNKTIERSNVNVTEEMTGLISSQRALQTASQALKIYDMVQDKAVSEIGKIN